MVRNHKFMGGNSLQLPCALDAVRMLKEAVSSIDNSTSDSLEGFGIEELARTRAVPMELSLRDGTTNIRG
jgi:hypothetical protein